MGLSETAGLPEEEKTNLEDEMRIRTVTLALAAATILVLSMGGTALALHSGGVAHCDACHTMHNSLGGTTMTTNAGATRFNGLATLLKGSDPSSTCLNCHGSGTTLSSYHVYTPGMTTAITSPVPAQRTPGGDFSWMKYATGDTTGQNRGHNILAADYGFTTGDSRFPALSPGGEYPSAAFYCTSCHDPHGKFRILDDGTVSDGVTNSAPIKASGSYADNTGAVREPLEAGLAVGSYRLLGGVGYTNSSGFTFTQTVPAALAPSTYNASDNAVGSFVIDQVRVAYGSGMSEWCANCHASIHNDNYPGTKRHPTGASAELGTIIAGNYNSYVKTADLSGSIASSFLNLVPFETGAGQDTTGRNAMAALVISAQGPTGTANVSCLTCHRAHASGFGSMMRWASNEEMVVEGGEWTAPGNGWEQAGVNAAYYERPASQFATFQRGLCNKCHVKD